MIHHKFRQKISENVCVIHSVKNKRNMMHHIFRKKSATVGLHTSRADEYAKKLNRHAVQWVDKMYTHRQCALARQGG